MSIEDIGTQKHFKSNNAPDHEIFCGDSLPKPLQDIYQLKCDAKPPLDAFNIFRDDGKCSLSYFTNPAYFFDLWLETERKKLAKVRFQSLAWLYISYNHICRFRRVCFLHGGGA